MDYSSLLIGAAAGWGANVVYNTGISAAPTVMMASVQSNPIGLIYPLAGAFVGMNYMSSLYPLPSWAWAAIGANLAVMFLPGIVKI